MIAAVFQRQFIEIEALTRTFKASQSGIDLTFWQSRREALVDFSLQVLLQNDNIPTLLFDAAFDAYSIAISPTINRHQNLFLLNNALLNDAFLGPVVEKVIVLFFLQSTNTQKFDIGLRLLKPLKEEIKSVISEKAIIDFISVLRHLLNPTCEMECQMRQLVIQLLSCCVENPAVLQQNDVLVQIADSVFSFLSSDNFMDNQYINDAHFILSCLGCIKVTSLPILVASQPSEIWSLLRDLLLKSDKERVNHHKVWTEVSTHCLKLVHQVAETSNHNMSLGINFEETYGKFLNVPFILQE